MTVERQSNIFESRNKKKYFFKLQRQKLALLCPKRKTQLRLNCDKAKLLKVKKQERGHKTIKCSHTQPMADTVTQTDTELLTTDAPAKKQGGQPEASTDRTVGQLVVKAA